MIIWCIKATKISWTPNKIMSHVQTFWSKFDYIWVFEFLLYLIYLHSEKSFLAILILSISILLKSRYVRICLGGTHRRLWRLYSFWLETFADLLVRRGIFPMRKKWSRHISPYGSKWLFKTYINHGILDEANFVQYRIWGSIFLVIEVQIPTFVAFDTSVHIIEEYLTIS